MEHKTSFRALRSRGRNQSLIRFISNLASKNELNSKRPDVPIFSIFNNSSPKITLLDLPAEVFKRIIYFVHCSGHSIIPIITSCKQFYNIWAYLIYMTKVVQINDDTRFRSNGSSSSSSKAVNTLNYLKNHKMDVAAHITVLNLRTRTSIFRSDKLPVNSEIFFDVLPSMQRLIVLTIDANEPRTLFQSFCHLPKNLQVFKLKINLTEHQISKINIKIFKTDITNLSKSKKLEYIEIVSTLYDLSYKRIHPEFGTFDTNNAALEGFIFGDFFNTKMARIIDLIHKKSNKILVKDKIGEVIYNFLQKNRSKLIKIELLAIDLRLIFNIDERRIPFTFDQLRMFVFDNTSRVFLQHWLSYFQQANQVPCYRGMYPLLVCLDRLGERIYFQHTRLSDFPALLHIERWEHSNQMRAKYAFLNQERAIHF